MKKEQILDLMNTVPPDLIEEAGIQPPKQRRLSKLVRVGLIAACLCLVLIGTASAVRYYIGIRLVDGDDGFTLAQGGIAYVPYDSLSEEIRAIIEEANNSTVIREAFSWQDVENLIGIDLMNNPVLDASPSHNYFAERHGVMGRFHVEPSRHSICAYGCFEIGDVNINVESRLFIENSQSAQENWDETFLGIKFLDDSDVTQDSYTAPSGLITQIMEVHTPRENSSDSFDCYGFFSLDGIPTIVRCASSTSMEEARTVLHQILDGFILS